MDIARHNTDHDSLASTATVNSHTGPPYLTKYDDEHISSNTHLLNPSVPYRHTITVPRTSPRTYRLTLLANRQVPWTTGILDTYVPTGLNSDLRHTLLKQTPTITKASTTIVKPARDLCNIYCLAFHGLTATSCYKLFRTRHLPLYYNTSRTTNITD